MVSMLQVRDIELRLRLQQRSQHNFNIDGARRLLGLPTIHADEVFSSWLARLMLSRKINKRKLLEEVGMHSSFYMADLKSEAFDLHKLVLRFNLIQVGMLERSFVQFNLRAPAADSICLTTDIFNRKPIYRFCPVCIDEQPYIRKSWRYAFSYACTEHGCLLLERCTECGESISFENLNISKLDDFGITDLRRCLSCSAEFSIQKPMFLAERTMQQIVSAQDALIEELSRGTDVSNYIAQVHYLENGALNYLNIGVSGQLVFQDSADEVRTAFMKAGVFLTTHWQPAGRIYLQSGIGKLNGAKRWALKQLN
jgi:hypothetical protein